LSKGAFGERYDLITAKGALKAILSYFFAMLKNKRP
jgi:hypothetical protein